MRSSKFHALLDNYEKLLTNELEEFDVGRELEKIRNIRRAGKFGSSNLGAIWMMGSVMALFFLALAVAFGVMQDREIRGLRQSLSKDISETGDRICQEVCQDNQKLKADTNKIRSQVHKMNIWRMEVRPFPGEVFPESVAGDSPKRPSD